MQSGLMTDDIWYEVMSFMSDDRKDEIMERNTTRELTKSLVNVSFKSKT